MDRSIRFYLAGILCLFVGTLTAQTEILKGEVKDTEGNPVDYFNVLLLSPADSSLVKGNVFTDGAFLLKEVPRGRYLLRILNIQYQPLDTFIQVKPDMAPFASSFRLVTNQLREVEVISTRPVVKQKAGNLTLDIKNSFLKDEGTLLSVLEKSPGILVDKGGSVSVLGKGKTVVYVNDKEVRSNSELLMIQAADVDKIEIIRHPGAMYRSDGDAVVKIKTKKYIHDVLNFSLLGNVFYGRNWGGNINLRGLYHKKGYSHYFTYRYDKDRATQYDLSDSYIYHPKDTTWDHRQTTMEKRSDTHDVFYSFEDTHSDKYTWGIQYTGSWSDEVVDKDSPEMIYRTYEKSPEQRQAFIKKTTDNYLHNFSVNYKYAFSDRNALLFITDYAFSKEDLDNEVTERLITDPKATYTRSVSDDKYQLFSSDLSFRSKQPWLNYTAGAKYAWMRDDASFAFRENSSDNLIRDHIAALYFSAGRKVGLLEVSAGIRAEYNRSDLRINEDGETDHLIRDWFNLFPDLSLSIQPKDGLEAGISYSRKTTRPALSQMNPRFVYLDSLSYIKGNPTLKPEFLDEIDFNLTLWHFSVSMEYLIWSHTILQTFHTPAPESEIIAYTYENIEKGRSLDTYLDFNYSFSKVSLLLGAIIQKPFFDIPVDEGTYKVHRPLYLLKATLNWKPFDDTSLTGTFVWRSKGEQWYSYYDSLSRLTLSLNQYFLHKKLRVSLSVYDVFNKWKPNCWEKRLHNVYSMMHSDNESRYANLSVQYNFDVGSFGIGKKSANRESLNRR